MFKLTIRSAGLDRTKSFEPMLQTLPTTAYSEGHPGILATCHRALHRRNGRLISA